MPNSVLIPIVVVVGLAFIWLPIMMIAVIFSGWWDLAKRYRARKPALGARRGVGSVFFSPLFRYKKFVAYAIDDDHLHLRLPPVIGALHAPMSIPWHAIDLPTDLPTLRGMIPAVIDGKRIFISKAMASRELEVRDLIEGESAPDQAEPIN
ncbi:MAG: hypothetical protein ABL309_05405 [Phycisphaerales bacterium]